VSVCGGHDDLVVVSFVRLDVRVCMVVLEQQMDADPDSHRIGGHPDGQHRGREKWGKPSHVAADSVRTERRRQTGRRMRSLALPA
jgi:hypothetical protein